MSIQPVNSKGCLPCRSDKAISCLKFTSNVALIAIAVLSVAGISQTTGCVNFTHSFTWLSMAIDKISYIEVFGTLLGGVIALRLALYFGPKYLDYRDKKVLAQKTEEEDRLQISQLTMGSFFADSKDQLWMWDVGSQSAGEAREAGPRAITIPGATKQDYEALIRGEFYQDNRGHKWKITQGELASPD